MDRLLTRKELEGIADDWKHMAFCDSDVGIERMLEDAIKKQYKKTINAVFQDFETYLDSLDRYYKKVKEYRDFKAKWIKYE